MSTIIHTVDRAKLRGEDPGADHSSPAVDDTGWLDIDIPGDVRRALVAAGEIDDPNRDASDTASAWVDDKEWWYRFPLDGVTEAGDDALVLRFEGIDTFATVFVDGEARHTGANMFRVAEIDVTAALATPGPHVVAVRIDRPHDHTVGGFENRRGDARATMRKAQFGYGWDFAPSVPSIGIWRPVTLHRRRGAFIESVRFQTLRLDGWDATVGIDVFVSGGDAAATIRLTSPAGVEVFTTTVPVVHGVARAVGVIRDAALWWPHDHGTPALHDLRVELLCNERVTDTHASTVGIRTIVLDESADPDELGTRFFRFVVNGRPIFAKGANWVPCDMAVGAIAPGRYEELLTIARDSNMNMLRIWGGGVYEHDAFYDVCDALGLLVWQEFMFACVRYPDQDPEWLDNIRAEARDQVRRLRSRACVALWCGNNEIEVIQSYMGPERDRSSAANIFYDVLPSVVAEEDGVLGYIPSSPMLGNDGDQGDRHGWDVWHGLATLQTILKGEATFDLDVATALTGPAALDPDSEAGRAKAESMSATQYLTDDSRFPSEFGLRSVPARATLARWIDEADLVLDHPQVTGRNRDTMGPANKLELAISLVGGRVHDLDDLIDLGQLTQAEGLKLGVEHFRRRWPHCAGTLIWQFDDPWPGASWSLVDYAGRIKGALAYAARFYAPVLASLVAETDGSASLWVVNDTDATVTDTLHARLARFTGGEVWSEDVPVTVGARTSQRVATWTPDQIEAGPDRVLSVRSRITPPNRVFFVPPKDLDRAPAKVAAEVAPTGDGRLVVTLTADTYALFAHVIVDDPTVRFDDNYIDLEAGEARTLTSLAPTDVGADRISVRSL